MSAIGPIRKAASSSSEWETPPDLFARIALDFDFTVDAAASAENAKVPRFVTADQNALDLKSFMPVKEVIWCNPPYGHLLAWVAAFDQWAMVGGCTVVALLPANTDTVWFKRCWRADEIRFLFGRVNFVGSRGGNTGGSMLAIWYGRSLCRGQVSPRVTLWDWRS